jgi:L-asparaginase
MDNAGRPRVGVFTLGGTIAMTPTEDGGVAPALSAHDLLAAVPGLREVQVQLEVRDFRSKPGASLSFSDLSDLATAIKQALDDGCAGIVVTQGTDTIEEVSYFLDLVLDVEAPVVVTGAMRNPAMAGADGPANILNAVKVAASPQAQRSGCLVSMNNEIHAARWVQKVHTGSVAAFASPNIGPLGHVLEGSVCIPVLLRNSSPTIQPDATSNVRVGLITISLGDDGTLIEAMGQRADGLVIGAFGAGHVPDIVVPFLSKLADRMPVVLASRTGAGPVHSRTYSFPGSEKDLAARGLISAGYLDPLKARILLRLLIASGAGGEQIRATFAEAGCHNNDARI